MVERTYEYDVFLSYANEDREAVARPLQERLEAQAGGIACLRGCTNGRRPESSYTHRSSRASRSLGPTSGSPMWRREP